jgi:hypothetical protein
MPGFKDDRILDAPVPSSVKKLSDYQLAGFLEEDHRYARILREYISELRICRKTVVATINTIPQK